MKKILAFILVLATLCFCMTSCNEDLIESLQDHKDEYDYHPTVVKDITLEVYLICDDISDLAKETVTRQISQYTKTNFKTELNIHYVKAADYDSTVRANIGTANLILINSVTLMNDLVSEGKLADVASYFGTDTYGTLNVTIAESLLDAAMTDDGKCYCVPNNHIITPYTYAKININEVHKKYHYSLAELRTMTTEAQIAQLQQNLRNAGMSDVDVAANVVVYEGKYEDRVTEENGYVCNVLQYPTVDDEEVCKSAFAIVNQKGIDTERVFEIIYAINTDETLRNLLQYGVKGTNYTMKDVVIEDQVAYSTVVRSDGDYTYLMDLLYTGDIFHALYCDELGYKPSVAEYGKLQNQESVKGNKVVK